MPFEIVQFANILECVDKKAAQLTQLGQLLFAALPGVKAAVLAKLGDDRRISCLVSVHFFEAVVGVSHNCRNIAPFEVGWLTLPPRGRAEHFSNVIDPMTADLSTNLRTIVRTFHPFP